MGKFIGWYAFAAVGGFVSGLMFSRAQYWQGRIDEAEECKEALMKFKEELEKRSES